ncbi:MAG: hypothetical protein ACJASZ_001424 [Yoonia sp.]|jgi:hypothetical protein
MEGCRRPVAVLEIRRDPIVRDVCRLEGAGTFASNEIGLNRQRVAMGTLTFKFFAPNAMRCSRFVARRQSAQRQHAEWSGNSICSKLITRSDEHPESQTEFFILKRCQTCSGQVFLSSTMVSNRQQTDPTLIISI